MTATLANTRRPVEGTISHGTLRTQDLLRSFADAYEYYNPSNHEPMTTEARAFADKLDNENATNLDHEEAMELVNELHDAMNSLASLYEMRFGAHEGDGSDFGFWAINEDPDFDESDDD